MHGTVHDRLPGLFERLAFLQRSARHWRADPSWKALHDSLIIARDELETTDAEQNAEWIDRINAALGPEG